MDIIASAIVSGLLTAVVGFLLGKKYESRNSDRSTELAQNILESLERLSELHSSGKLTDDEWNEQKRALLYWPTYLSNRSRLVMLQRRIKDPQLLLRIETMVLDQDRRGFEKLIEKGHA